MSSHGDALFEQPVDVAGEVALEQAHGLALALALADAAGDVGGGGWIVAAAGEDDLVEAVVELAVAAAVESVADEASGAGGDRCCACQPGEGGLAAQPAAVRPGDERLGGTDWSDARLGQELRCDPACALMKL